MGMLEDIFSHGLYRADGHADVLLAPRGEEKEPPVQHMAAFGPEAGIDTPMPKPPPEMEWYTDYRENADGLIEKIVKWQYEKGTDPFQYAKMHEIVYHVREVLRRENGRPKGKRDYTVTEKPDAVEPDQPEPGQRGELADGGAV